MSIAVTAASGQLGSEVVRAVVALVPDAQVVALARTPEKAKHLGVEDRVTYGKQDRDDAEGQPAAV